MRQYIRPIYRVDRYQQNRSVQHYSSMHAFQDSADPPLSLVIAMYEMLRKSCLLQAEMPKNKNHAEGCTSLILVQSLQRDRLFWRHLKSTTANSAPFAFFFCPHQLLCVCFRPIYSVACALRERFLRFYNIELGSIRVKHVLGLGPLPWWQAPRWE